MRSGYDKREAYGPFYRLKGAANQDAAVLAKQLLSGELWGEAGRLGLDAAAKAHRGPLPPNQEGFEFWTFQASDNWDGPRVFWRRPGDFLIDSTEHGGNVTKVRLLIAFVKITQKLHSLLP